MNCLTTSILLATVVAMGDDRPTSQPAPGMLEAQLKSEAPKSLAAEAHRLGDARRGAIVFYQPALMCVRCHLEEERGVPKRLGPDLGALGKAVPDTELVEAILEPSKSIKKGYETVTIVTEDGHTVSGLLVEDRPDTIVLRDPGRSGLPVAISKSQIDSQSTSGPSLMPAGLVNALASRQQFLDLMRYLMEITEYGPARPEQLDPIQRCWPLLCRIMKAISITPD